ncbi:MAG: CDP-alcohol phosphatidyltransferase family protein [Planctomycetota bacterium]|jgi:CDP-diacylglycerol--serine O-phosphatidyltransferase
MKRIGVFPTLITAANGYCGVLAIYKAQEGLFYSASFLILLAMVFDVLDGKVARMAGVTSSFGAYLDSLSDAISFGVAPAFLAKTVVQNEGVWSSIYHPKILAFLTILFAIGALLRLARYNVEHTPGEGRATSDGEAVSAFSGIPTPGAAGVIAGWVFLAYDARAPLDYRPAVAAGLPIACAVLGFLMISRVKYVHAGTRFLQGRRDFAYLFMVVVLAGLMVRFPEESAAAGFSAYAISGPLLGVFRKSDPPSAPVEDEVEDEVEIPEGY